MKGEPWMHSLLLLSSLTLVPGADLGAQAESQPVVTIDRGTEVSKLSEQQRALLQKDLAARQQAPIAYLIDKCSKHDIVMLGESHQVRQTCEFVASSLAPLYKKAGLRCLATEFLRSRHTVKANAILQAKTWDRDAMIALMRDNPWPTWGFREYLEIYKAVWTLNASLTEDDPKLQICGMDSNWNQYELWFAKLNRMKRFQTLLARESNMVDSIVIGPVARKEKVLIHVGLSHSVTNQGVKLGTRLRKDYGKRVAQVVMHHQLGGRKKPSALTALLETMTKSVGKGPVAFDIQGTPLAGLRDSEAMAFRGRPKSDLGTVFEGYIFLAPTAELEKCRWIPGFITFETFDKALALAMRMGWIEKDSCHTAKELDAALVMRFGK